MNRVDPRILSCQPSFKIDSYELAYSHYVDWLGFQLDWEWRADVDAPVIMSVSRDDLSLFLNEDPSTPANIWLRVSVLQLEALAAEWNSVKPGSIELVVEPPYDLPTAYVADPFGNGMALQQPMDEAAKAELQKQVAIVVDALVQFEQSGSALPSSADLVERFACTAGVASEALMTFRNRDIV